MPAALGPFGDPVAPSAPTGAATIWSLIYILRGDMERAADYMERSIRERHALAARYLGWNCWSANPRTASLKRMINL